MGLFSYLRRYPTMKNRGNHIVLMFDDFLVQGLVTREDYWNYVCICLYSDPTLFDLLLVFYHSRSLGREYSIAGN